MRAYMLFLATILSGCGPSIWTLNKGDSYPEHLDGALLSYTLAKGLVSFTADVKDGLVTVTSDQKVTAQPDFRHHYVLAYSHTPLSEDDINIEFDGAVLKKISSTTTDRSIEAIAAVNAVLTQAAAIQEAERRVKSFHSAAPAKTDLPPCTSLKSVITVDVTNNVVPKRATKQQRAANCDLDIKVTVGEPSQIMGVAGFPNGAVDVDSVTEQQCNKAVCFRLGASFTVTATGVLNYTKVTTELVDGKPTEKREYKSVPTEPLSFTALAPTAQAIGYVRFNRRAFVENNTTIAFTNGVLSSFSAKNASEVLGFLRLPAEILRGVAIAIPL